MKVHRIASLILTCILVSQLVYPTQITLAASDPATTWLHPYPAEILFSLDTTDKILQQEQMIYLLSDKDEENIRPFFTELRATDKRSTIPGDTLRIEDASGMKRENVDVTSGDITELKVKIDLTKNNYTAGEYEGRLRLLSQGSIAADITIKVSLIDQVVKTDLITTRPEKIQFFFEQDKPKSNSVELDVIPKRTIENLTVSFSDFYTVNGTRLQDFTIVPSGTAFNVTAIEPFTFRINGTLGDTYTPGTYKGEVKFTSYGVYTAVPITVVVSPFSVWYSYVAWGLVSSGIGLSVLLIVIKEGSKVRDALLESARKANTAFQLASNEGRLSAKEMFQGLQHFHVGVIAVRNNQFVEATNYFTKSKEFFDKSNKADAQTKVGNPPRIDDVELKTKKSMRITLSAFQGDQSLIITFSIAVVITILTTFQGVSRDLLLLDDPYDGVALILFGFGSPAIANQIVSLFKK